MIDPLGNVTTLAGQPGVCGPATDGSGSAALFGGPTNLRIHPTTGDLYVVDNDYCALYCIAAIRKVTPGGAVTTVVPSGGLLLSPWGLTIDGSGNFYVTDEDSSAVYKYDPAFSGSVLAGNPGVPGIQNGVGTGAGFGCPEGITLDPFDGSLVVSDCSSHDIRRIALPSATVSRVAGRPPLFGNANGSGTGASFSAPVGIAGFGTDLMSPTGRTATSAR